MKLVRAKVTNFKSIDDTGWVDVDDVTSMVGKNESGKTAFLGALKRLNPVDGKDKFDLKDYPRKGYVRYKRDHRDSPAIAITTEMELSDDELGQIEESLGKGALKSSAVMLARWFTRERSKYTSSFQERSSRILVRSNDRTPSERADRMVSRSCA